MDEGGTNPNGSKLQGAAGQVSATSVPNPVMRDFVSDWSPVHDASIHGRLLALQNLIKQGSDVNLLTADQVSPLHEACLGGHAACARLLLKHGAQVDAVTVDWHTPLFSACASGSVACLAVLLQHGASLHPPCDLASPLHEAARRGTCPAATDHSVLVTTLCSPGCSPGHISCLRHAGARMLEPSSLLPCLLSSSGASASPGSSSTQPCPPQGFWRALGFSLHCAGSCKSGLGVQELCGHN
ncbi:ankyrin repeat and SOCS box protein 9 isoform X3 [Dryobates pubescens]|uniref:ankyrin repeat and SOCS box protein 9 isoform X3 n=1 Tax=Dryobates pubescens TaxID=118200 RepID=UPI0023B887AE|nr:ankyrin repeat and SOCS box protein 9 isoform X3 [Dryobates pubescens]